jgi:hypothetical protein
MTKGTLTPYILVSVLIHTGFLIATHQFLRLPAEEVEPAELIPVEIVVLREEPPALRPRLAPDDQIVTEKALATKSQALTSSEIDQHTDDMPQPVPQPGNYEPSVTVATVTTLGVGAGTREGEETAGKPMVLAFQMTPLHLSPLDPSMPAESSPIEVKIPTVLVEAKAGGSPTYSQAPLKIEAPLASRRTNNDLASERLPTPQADNYEPGLPASTLQLKSHPIGAQIFVDGMLSGETPMKLELPLGKHEVRLALPDYYDWKAQITLTEEHQTFPIFFRLLPVEETNE